MFVNVDGGSISGGFFFFSLLTVNIITATARRIKLIAISAPFVLEARVVVGSCAIGTGVNGEKVG